MLKVQLTSILLFLLFLSNIALAQSDPLEEKFTSAYQLFEDGKVHDADSLLERLLGLNPTYGHGWDLLANVRLKEYEDAKDLKMSFGGKVTVTTKDKNGKAVPVENDTLAQKLAEMLNSMSPSKQAYSKLIYTLRKGTLLSDEAYNCNIMLRLLKVDSKVDTAVTRKALKYYNEGESEFEAKNYNTAAQLYRHALDEYPQFYKASLYLGDVYYATGDYASAITAFKEATRKFPDLLEPHKYLSDAYGKMKLYDQMIEEALQTLLIFPDYSMVEKIKDALYMQNRKLTVNWMQRGILPVHKNKKKGMGDLNEYSEKTPMQAAGPWVSYVAVGEKMLPFCNDKGIIVEPEANTAQRYLEVYCWEEMLKANPNDPALEDARKAKKNGELETYVLVAQFHYDFYPQYKDYVSRNREKVLKYYRDRIVVKL